jgi:hypothetical protein
MRTAFLRRGLRAQLLASRSAPFSSVSTNGTKPICRENIVVRQVLVRHLGVIPQLGKSNESLTHIDLNDAVENCQIMKAITAFDALNLQENKTALLDHSSSTRLCSLLSSTCSLDDLEHVLQQNRFSLNADISVNSSEAFIMSGKFSSFVSLFSKYLSHVPSPDSVSRIINAVILARSRRLMSQTDVTEDETMALEQLFSQLRSYHADYPSPSYHHDEEMSSIFAMKQLFFLENGRNSDDCNSEMSEEEAYFLSLTPAFENTPFEYVVEDRDIPLELEINDLTAQIANKQPEKFLLKGGTIFSKALQKEQKLLKIGSYMTENEEEDCDELTDNIRQKSFK